MSLMAEVLLDTNCKSVLLWPLFGKKRPITSFHPRHFGRPFEEAPGKPQAHEDLARGTVDSFISDEQKTTLEIVAAIFGREAATAKYFS